MAIDHFAYNVIDHYYLKTRSLECMDVLMQELKTHGGLEINLNKPEDAAFFDKISLL
jgi:hypothetical protein